MHAPRRSAAALGLGLAAALALASGARLGAQIPEAPAPPPNPSITPRRPMPESRFDFRGEHAGVIYTPPDWRTFGDPAADGQYFITPGGFSVFLPFSFSRGGSLTEPVALGSNYEIVRKPSRGASSLSAGASPSPAGAAASAPAPDPGHFELRAREEVIPGEWIEVYRPAVYETDAEGREQLVKKEEIIRTPKTRVVTSRVWIPGRLAPAAPTAPAR